MRTTPPLIVPRGVCWHLGHDVPCRARVLLADVEPLHEPTRAALALRASLVHTAELGMAREVTRGTRRARHDRAHVGFDAGPSKPDNPEAEDSVMTRD